MLLGLALTQHCNLRCPHCIRDDVTTVRSLDLPLIRSIIDQATGIFDRVDVSLTGGEPLLYPQFDELLDLLAERDLSYRFVSNGWHMGRVMPALDRYPPRHVRLSLSGVDEETHDAVRGRGSFSRVLKAAALLTSRGIPTSLSLVIDRVARPSLRAGADLTEALGLLGIFYILPQPSAGSLEMDSELSPLEWDEVRDEVDALAAEGHRRSIVGLDYGAPFVDQLERPCDTFALKRIYVDAWGRLATCCQLSDYGYNQTEVVADLNLVPFADAYRSYRERLEALAESARPDFERSPLDRFPCMRCARASGKLDWLGKFPEADWTKLSRQSGVRMALPVLR